MFPFNFVSKLKDHRYHKPNSVIVQVSFKLQLFPSGLNWCQVPLGLQATIKEITDQNYETYYKSSTLNKRGSYQLHHQLLCLEEHLLKPCLCL